MKIFRLTHKVDDHSHLMMLLNEKGVPGIQWVMAVHFRNKGTVATFIDKMIRAHETKTLGHFTYQRKFIQRAHFSKDGTYGTQAYTALLMMMLVNKLGCNKLIHMYSYKH